MDAEITDLFDNFVNNIESKLFTDSNSALPLIDRFVNAYSSNDKANIALLFAGSSYYHIFSVNNDYSVLRKAVNCFKKSINDFANPQSYISLLDIFLDNEYSNWPSDIFDDLSSLIKSRSSEFHLVLDVGSFNEFVYANKKAAVFLLEGDIDSAKEYSRKALNFMHA